MTRTRVLGRGVPLVTALIMVSAMGWGLLATPTAAQDRPNIVIIWGDDIGYWNVSAYNQGMMGYRTPNIDRLAQEGALFTDAYGERSCTAGRSAFITGQSPFRTGLNPAFRERFGPRGVIKSFADGRIEDTGPTIAGALGDDDLTERFKAGTTLDGKDFKVHLDGYNFMPYTEGDTEEPPRKAFFYFSDTGDLLNLRYNKYKVVFAEQRAHGVEVWREPFVFLRAPKLLNLRSDPFEEADEIGIGYEHWWVEHMFVFVPAQAIVADFLATFQEFPPRQTPASFTIDQVMEKLKPATN